MTKKRRGAHDEISPYPIDECARILQSMAAVETPTDAQWRVEAEPITQDRFYFKMTGAKPDRYGIIKRVASGVLNSIGNNQTHVDFDKPLINEGVIIVLLIVALVGVYLALAFFASAITPIAFCVIFPLSAMILFRLMIPLQEQRLARQRAEFEIAVALDLRDKATLSSPA